MREKKEELFPRMSVSLSLSDIHSVQHVPNIIGLYLSCDLDAKHADGTPTTEGYKMDVSSTNHPHHRLRK